MCGLTSFRRTLLSLQTSLVSPILRVSAGELFGNFFELPKNLIEPQNKKIKNHGLNYFNKIVQNRAYEPEPEAKKDSEGGSQSNEEWQLMRLVAGA